MATTRIRKNVINFMMILLLDYGFLNQIELYMKHFGLVYACNCKIYAKYCTIILTLYEIVAIVGS
jgi:hypothetical protein